MAHPEHPNGSASTAPVPKMQYGGYDRFTLELEFVQMLSNPQYLQHLAGQKLLDNPDFIAYLDYLQYFREPKYIKFLQYPGPTLRALELLQEERFRKEIIIPDVVSNMIKQGVEATTTSG